MTPRTITWLALGSAFLFGWVFGAIVAGVLLL